MLIDTHAHVNFLQYKDDGDEVVKRSLAEGTWLINVGSEKDTSRRAVEYANRYEAGVFAAVGLYPGNLVAQEFEEKIGGEMIKISSAAEVFDEQYYSGLASEAKVVAIGEIGLDYYRNGAAKELQKEVLLAQLKLAGNLNKPVLLHCRQAHDDLLEILRQAISDKRLAARGVLHSFSGTLGQAQEYLAMGFHLGFNGIITFTHDYDEVIKTMPFDRILVETDCPYLTPVPLRGKRNEPGYVRYVAEKIADLRGVSFEDVAGMTTTNARKLFKI
jgi:TatD DNase family protein